MDFVLNIDLNSNNSIISSFLQHILANCKSIFLENKLETKLLDKILILINNFHKINNTDEILSQMKENLTQKIKEINLYSNELNNFIGRVLHRIGNEIENNIQNQHFIENRVLTKLRANFFINHVVIDLELSKEKKILFNNKKNNFLFEGTINGNINQHYISLSE